ncbi:MAG: hypothetical protein ACYTEX_11135 [Planctomycetota bacterium]|jgi:hypothetical protein
MMRTLLYRLEGGSSVDFDNATMELYEILGCDFPDLLPDWLRKQGKQIENQV